MPPHPAKIWHDFTALHMFPPHKRLARSAPTPSETLGEQFDKKMIHNQSSYSIFAPQACPYARKPQANAINGCGVVTSSLSIRKSQYSRGVIPIRVNGSRAETINAPISKHRRNLINFVAIPSLRFLIDLYPKDIRVIINPVNTCAAASSRRIQYICISVVCCHEQHYSEAQCYVRSPKSTFPSPTQFLYSESKWLATATRFKTLTHPVANTNTCDK